MSIPCPQTWQCSLPGHPLFLTSLTLFTLTPLSGIPFLFFSTYSLFKPQIRCHLLYEVLSDCVLHPAQVSFSFFLGTHNPKLP